MSERASIIDNGVEGIRTGGVSQTTGDWIDQNTPDCIEVVGGFVSNGFGEG